MRNREVSPAGANSYSSFAWSVTLRPLERQLAGAGTPPALLKLVGGPSGSFGMSGLVGSGNADDRSQSLDGYESLETGGKAMHRLIR